MPLRGGSALELLEVIEALLAEHHELVQLRPSAPRIHALVHQLVLQLHQPILLVDLLFNDLELAQVFGLLALVLVVLGLVVSEGVWEGVLLEVVFGGLEGVGSAVQLVRRRVWGQQA